MWPLLLSKHLSQASQERRGATAAVGRKKSFLVKSEDDDDNGVTGLLEWEGKV